MMTHRRLIASATMVTLGLAACGGSSSSTSAETAAAAAVAASTADAPAGAAAFNAADLTFAQGMIPHHEQAIEMADIALDPTIGASDTIKRLATGVKASQDPEVTTMKGWFTAWGQSEAMDMSGDQMSSMDGMMSTADMDALGALKGTEFDKKWAEMMAAHHEGAIAMAQTVKAAGSNADVLALADAVIKAQQAELIGLKAIAGG